MLWSSPDLNTGITLAIFRLEGTQPVEKERLKMWERGSAIKEITDFIAVELMPSNPQLALVLSSLPTQIISWEQVGVRKKRRRVWIVWKVVVESRRSKNLQLTAYTYLCHTWLLLVYKSRGYSNFRDQVVTTIGFFPLCYIILSNTLHCAKTAVSVKENLLRYGLETEPLLARIVSLSTSRLKPVSKA